MSIFDKLFLVMNFYIHSERKIEEANNFVFKEITFEELNKYEESLKKVYSNQLLKRRFENKYRLSSILENGEPVSFAWNKVSKEHYIGEINKTLVFQYQINCIIDCHTLPSYRGKGYYSKLINALSNKYDCPSLIYANKNNIGSNKGIIKAGFIKSMIIRKFLKVVFTNNFSVYNFSIQ